MREHPDSHTRHDLKPSLQSQEGVCQRLKQDALPIVAIYVNLVGQLKASYTLEWDQQKSYSGRCRCFLECDTRCLWTSLGRISWKNHPSLDTQQSYVSYFALWIAPQPHAVGEGVSQLHSSGKILLHKVSASKSSSIVCSLSPRTVWHQCWCDET